jgi:hypothetical protein
VKCEDGEAKAWAEASRVKNSARWLGRGHKLMISKALGGRPSTPHAL